MQKSQIAPFSLYPKFDARPWGSFDLAPVYDYSIPSDAGPIGEAWLTGEQCRVKNGQFSGSTLREMCSTFGRDIVGSASRDSSRFPLLLKFLFTQDRLSVQVHPDDHAAQSVGEPCGKTECWYVVHAQPDAAIALGLKPAVDKLRFLRAIEENRAEELLNWVGVQAGDMIYVAAGTVHTIGPGVIIFEVQQNSDTTYRLYDYGRPRELHLEQGVAALKEVTDAGKVAAVRRENGAERLISAEHFAIERHVFNGTRAFQTKRGYSPQCLVALEGSGAVTAAGFVPARFASGEALIVPASINEFVVESEAPVQLLKCCLP